MLRQNLEKMLRQNLEKMLHQVVQTILSYPIASMTATMTASIVVGLVSLNMVETQRDLNLKRSDMYSDDSMEERGEEHTATNNNTNRRRKKVFTPEEARVRAMIDNAKASTWRENLSNAAEAHRHFVLPPGHVNHSDSKPSRETSRLLQNIEKRSEELLYEQQKELERQSKRKLTTRFWKN